MSMTPLDLQFAATQNDTGNAIGDLTKLREKFGSQSDELVRLLTSGASSSAIIERELATDDAKNQANSIAFANKLGTNLDSTTEIMSALALKERATADMRDASLETVKRKQATSILDNPLQWAMNRLTINSDIDTYNSANIQHDQTVSRIAELNRVTQDTIKTQNELHMGHTAITVAERANKVKSAALAQAQVANLNAIQYDGEAISKITALGQNLYSNEMSKKHLQLQEQAHADALADRAMRQQEFDARIKEGKAVELDMITRAEDYNRGMQLLNPKAAVLTPREVNIYLQTPGPTQDLAKHAEASGAALRMGVRTTGNAGQTGQMLYAAGVNGTEGTIKDSTNKLLLTAYNDIMTKGIPNGKGQNIMPDITKPKEITIAADNEAKRVADTHAKFIKPGDQDNIYQAPPVASLLSAKVTNVVGSPTVGDLPFVREVITPALTAGMTTDLTPTVIHQLGAKYIARKVMEGAPTKRTVEEAALGIYAIYSAARATNNAHKEYTSKGLPKQANFKTEIDSPSRLFSKTRLIDETNLTQISEALMMDAGNLIYRSDVGVK